VEKKGKASKKQLCTMARDGDAETFAIDMASIFFYHMVVFF
jgi:hypothetical protein